MVGKTNGCEDRRTEVPAWREGDIDVEEMRVGRREASSDEEQEEDCIGKGGELLGKEGQSGITTTGVARMRAVGLFRGSTVSQQQAIRPFSSQNLTSQFRLMLVRPRHSAPVLSAIGVRAGCAWKAKAWCVLRRTYLLR